MTQNPIDPKVAKELEEKLGQIRTKETERSYADQAAQHGIPFSNLKRFPISTEALSLLEEDQARQGQIAPINKTGSKLTLALLDPENQLAKDIIERFKSRGFETSLIITTTESFTEILKRYAFIARDSRVEIGAIEIDEHELEELKKDIKNIDDLRQRVQSVSVTRVFETIIAGALKTGSSDIHFEPERSQTKLRYRFDGLLHDVLLLENSYYEKILSRVKVISKMKINIRRAPQDGRFTIRESGTAVEVRVSILPSEFGETIVMRLLDPRSIRTQLTDLGIRPRLLETIKDQLARPNGGILTTGPTGSGKTTALYAFVNFINSSEMKIVTIEDPIEYHVDGISQTQVDAKRGYDFASGLRAIVRQDPDVILVGEIRDKETAEIAMNAALTGHLVLSTLHTNDAAGAIPRLIDLGVKAEAIAPALNLILAQRLVRLLNPQSKKERLITPIELEKLTESLNPLVGKVEMPKLDEKLTVYGPGKDESDNNTGYRGRVGIFEGFVVSEKIQELILRNPSTNEIRNVATAEGMLTMKQDAYLRFLEGVTSFEEIERVVGT